MKTKLKPPRTRHLKLKYDALLSGFAFKFNLRRYLVRSLLSVANTIIQVWRRRLPLSNPR